MTTYTIKKGRKNFRPIESPMPIWKPKGFEFTAKINRGGWSSLEEWEGDKDWYDWQKIKGLTNFFSLNNKQSSMYAFAYGDDFETYKITPYTNDKKGGWFAGKIMVIESEELFTGRAFLKDNKAFYEFLSEGNKTLKSTHDLKTFRVAREVGTYAGGANNSEGKYGGRAFKNMSIDIDFKIIK